MVKAGSLVTKKSYHHPNDSAWRRVRVSHPDFRCALRLSLSDCLSLSEEQ
jgi:hypothetical protein